MSVYILNLLMKTILIVLIGIFSLFFTTKFNIFPQIDCFYFRTFYFEILIFVIVLISLASNSVKVSKSTRQALILKIREASEKNKR